MLCINFLQAKFALTCNTFLYKWTYKIYTETYTYRLGGSERGREEERERKGTGKAADDEPGVKPNVCWEKKQWRELASTRPALCTLQSKPPITYCVNQS